MTEIVRICGKHGELTKSDVSTNNRCLACSREYAKAYRLSNPDKVKAQQKKHMDNVREMIKEMGEYKPIRENKRYTELRTSITCKKHGFLDKPEMMLREGDYIRCKLCSYERNRSWEKRNPEKVKAQKRRTYLSHCTDYADEARLRPYKITKEQYNILLLEQNDKCAICHREESMRKRMDGTRSPLAIDHDHNTGKIRGLLCNKCNRGLGYFNDSIERLSNAIDYLRRSNDGSSKSESANPIDSA